MIRRILNFLHRTYALASLQVHILDRVLVFLKLFCKPVTKFFSQPQDHVVWSCRKFGKTFSLHLDGTHATYLTVYEILCLEEYAVAVDDPKFIFDIGANIGLVSVYYALRFPGVQIYSFEPSSNAFKYLQKNTVQFHNIHIYNVALSDIDGEVSFYENTEKLIASSLQARAGARSEQKVTSWTLDSAITQTRVSHIDLVKFDIEGAEYAVFSTSKKLHLIKHVVGELHEDLMQATKDDFIRLFTHITITCIQANKQYRYICYA